MRTRDKKCSDYGMTDDEARRIKKYCQNASAEDKLTLLQCAYPPLLAWKLRYMRAL